MFNKNRGSRVFHLMMILPAGVLLLILSLISLSTLAVINKQFSDEYVDRDSGGGDKCILFAENEDGEPEFSDGRTCEFSIVGVAIIAGFALLFTLVLVGKAIIGVQVVSITSFLELLLAILGCIWAFVMSIVLTVGLSETCKAYGEAYDVDKFPCCSYYYPYAVREAPDGNSVFFYEGVNASRITAWLTMALLLFLAIIYLCIVCKYFCGGGRKKKQETKSVISTGPIEIEENTMS